jgi:hypothetical protein
MINGLGPFAPYKELLSIIGFTGEMGRVAAIPVPPRE